MVRQEQRDIGWPSPMVGRLMASATNPARPAGAPAVRQTLTTRAAIEASEGAAHKVDLFEVPRPLDSAIR
jgi:hypothetical protein